MIINSYNLSRAFLAFGLLLTLTFNSNYTLFGLDIIHLESPVFDYNLFYLLKENLLLAKLISVLILCLVISGIYPRLTGILHWYITYSFFLSADVADGGDHIAVNLTLLLIPITLLDKRKNHWFKNTSVSNKTYQIFYNSFFFLIAIQVCAIYLHAFVGKLFVNEWQNGTAVYYWLTHNHFGVNPSLLDTATLFLSNKYFVTLITWGTLFFEFILSACIILNRDDKRRYYILVLGLFFHFSIMIFHGLVSFFFTMSAALILYLMPNNKNFKLKDLKIKKYVTNIQNNLNH